MDDMASAPLVEPAGGGAMSENELAAALEQHELRAVGYYNSEIANEQARALDYYYGRPFGDEQAGRSQVVDRTVAITVDNGLAALLKPFVSADETVCFEPVGPEDVEQAEQATEYVNYVLHNDNQGFLVFHNWFKDALLSKIGIVKAWWQDSERKRREDIEALDAQQVELLMQGQGEDDYTIIDGPYQDENGLYSISLERMVADGKITIENVPPEEFLISPFARTIEDAAYCAHRPMTVTRSDLLEWGFDRETVEMLPAFSGSKYNENRQFSRYQDEQWGVPGTQGTPGDKSTDVVSFIDEYIKIDYDGDGVSELRRVIRSDHHILFNEEVDDNPFAIICPVLMPHKVYGMSVADQVLDLQRISSVVWRQTLDNLYLSNNPRPIVPDGAVNERTYDTLVDPAPGAEISVKGMNANVIDFMQVPFVAEKSFPMLGYIEQQGEARSGVRRGGRNLKRDALNDNAPITATQASINEEQENERTEMIARIFAETGVKRLFKIILRLLINHQPRERMIRLRKKWVPMDPRSWNAEMDVSISVGLGTGSKVEQQTQSQSVLQIQAELAQTQFAQMLTPENVYNAITRAFNANGIKNVEEYISDPAQMEPQQPKPDPEMVKAQDQAQKSQAEFHLKAQQTDAQLQLSQAESAAKLEQMQQEAALKLQLEREKAAAQIQLDRERMVAEMELARENAQMQADLAERNAQRQHEVALSTAQAKISQNRPGGDLDK